MKNLLATTFLGMFAVAAEASEAMLLRVFLADGTAVVSYGEYARVGDRVVFSMPIGGAPDAPALHLVNLPAHVVDWDQTTKYADAARATHYAALQGESEYALLTASVARTLNDIALATSAKTRLELALQARRELEQWPSRRYGYRATDVRQILGILDEAIAELRAAAGETRFDLNLVASVGDPAPRMALLPAPSTQDSVVQAMRIARLSDVPADRRSLLSAIVGALDRNAPTLPAAWVDRQRRAALDAIAAETRVERTYGQLTRSMLHAAATAAARADVVKIERLLDDVRRRDRQLGRRRPGEVEALLAAMQARLDAARTLRLARDQWLIRQPAVVAYRYAIKDAFAELSRSRSRLDAIRRLAGPEPSVLTTLATGLESAARRLTRINPPDELKAAHQLLVSASQLATRAVDVRREAVHSGSLAVAWDASAAAAGAMMLFSQARAELDTRVRVPQLR